MTTREVTIKVLEEDLVVVFSPEEREAVLECISTFEDTTALQQARHKLLLAIRAKKMAENPPLL